MESKKSFFDWTVFKKTVCRFWPLWAAYFVLWLIMLPLEGLMYLRMDASHIDEFGSYMENFAESMVAGRAETALPFAVIFGVMAAMAVFSHLYNARSANLYGSLPVRREGLFLTHYLAGLSFLLVPNGAVFLLTLLVEAAGGCVVMQGLWFWLGVSCGECFLFYSMAVFCAMFTGHILALPVFYGVFNVFVAGVEGLLYLVLDNFYYGFAGFGGWAEELAQWCTPVWKLSGAVSRVWLDGEAGRKILTTRGMDTVGVYVLAAVVLTVCAFFLYRARRLESAGDVVSVQPMRPVFKYGVALCSGLVFGMGTTVVLGGGEFTLMASILIWGVVGYFVAQMLLDKSFRVFQKWKGGAAVAGVFIALFLVVGFDLTGYETRVPDPAEVRSVYVSGLGVVNYADSGDQVSLDVDDPGQIELLVALHQAAVDDREDRWHAGGSVSTMVELNYTLSSGSTLRRSYYVNVEPEERDQAGTAAWALERLYHNPDLYWRVYGFDELERLLAEGGRLEGPRFSHYDEEWGSADRVVAYGEKGRALLNAVEEDLMAGRIGVRTLADARDYYRYNPRDTLSFSVTEPASGKTLWTVAIALQDTASSTLAVLKDLAEDMDLSGEDGQLIREALEGWLGSSLGGQ